MFAIICYVPAYCKTPSRQNYPILRNGNWFLLFAQEKHVYPLSVVHLFVLGNQ